MRITVNGDWTNAGNIAASVQVVSLTDPAPVFTTQGKIGTEDTVVVPIVIPAGTSSADFRLGWREHWGQYPTNDLDLFLIRPNGTANVDGATESNPEHVTIANPPAGNWLAVIIGFDVAGRSDKYELRVALDGRVVKQ